MAEVPDKDTESTNPSTRQTDRDEVVATSSEHTSTRGKTIMFPKRSSIGKCKYVPIHQN